MAWYLQSYEIENDTNLATGTRISVRLKIEGDRYEEILAIVKDLEKGDLYEFMHEQLILRKFRELLVGGAPLEDALKAAIVVETVRKAKS